MPILDGKSVSVDQIDPLKHRFVGTLKKSTDTPDGSYGPGVNDSNSSALGEGS